METRNHFNKRGKPKSQMSWENLKLRQMKRKLQFAAITCILSCIISSCTMEKRVYVPGYNVEWKNFNNSREKIDVTKKTNSETTEQISNKDKLNPINSEQIETEENITASVDNSNVIIYKQNNIPKLITTNTLNTNQGRTRINDILLNPEPCDKIILQDGSRINGKVMEISSNQVKYKNCEDINGPMITLDKPNVYMIKYSNGTKETITPKPSSNSDRTEQGRPERRRGGGFGIASFILGLFGFSVLAIIFGAIGLGRERPLKGLAAVGLILGIIWLIILIALLV